MDDLLVNSATRKLLDAYVRTPTHAVILTGAVGSGLGTLSMWLAQEITPKMQAITQLAPEKGLISIDRVRMLYELTRSISHEPRCVVIDDADAMSDDAQNALLKLFEEPVDNVHFILTTHRPQEILSTILSRAQHIEVLPISLDASQKLVKKYGFDAAKSAQVLFLAQLHPAELTRLCEDEQYFEMQASLIADARAFVQSSAYDRLRLAQKYNDRDKAQKLLNACSKLLNYSILKQKNPQGVDMLEYFDEVSARIAANGHVRTQLMYLVTKLG